MHDNHNPIENYTQVIHTIARHKFLLPEGEHCYAKVDDPYRDDPRDPDFLRVSIHSKGFTFNLLDEMQALGLHVRDVWQFDADKANNRIMLRIEEPDKDSERERQNTGEATGSMGVKLWIPMCDYHEMAYGRPFPDCEDCKQAKREFEEA